MPCQGRSGTEGDVGVSVGGSRRNHPALEPPAGLSQDPALFVTSAFLLLFGVIKARVVNMRSHALGGGGAGCVLSTEPRRAPPSPSTSARTPGTHCPSDVAPPGPAQLLCAHSPHPPDSSLGGGGLAPTLQGASLPAGETHTASSWHTAYSITCETVQPQPKAGDVCRLTHLWPSPLLPKHAHNYELCSL